MNTTSAAKTATALFIVTAPIGTTTTTPTAHPAGMSIVTLFTSTVTRRTLFFHGKGLRHFGVELEIDDGGTVNSNAQKLLDIANKDAENLYIKTDGSLDEGLGARYTPDDARISPERNAMGGSVA